jgi:hypothetical protein
MQFSEMSDCVGILSPFVGVGMPVVLVVGVVLLPTQYQVSCLISEQSSYTDGFQLIKSVLLKVPNMADMRSQVSSIVVKYHAVQSPGLLVGMGLGVAVTVGGMGLPSSNAATQYQFPAQSPLQLPLSTGFHWKNCSLVI